MCLKFWSVNLTQERLHNQYIMSNYPNIAINTKNGVEFINMDDILYCSSNGNYTNIHLKNNQKMMISKKLKDLEEGLDSNIFLRIHHSHLINLAGIKRLIKDTTNWSVIMQNDTVLSISKSRKANFQGRFTWF